MKDIGAFHVVCKRHNNVIQGYEVYCNNVPYIKGSLKPLGMREARWVSEKLNISSGMVFRNADENVA
jgi:hypothetical protein